MKDVGTIPKSYSKFTTMWRLNLSQSLFAGLMLLSSVSGCDRDSAVASTTEPSKLWLKTDSGLEYLVVEEGTGPMASAGDKALIHETTRLADGTFVTDTWKMNFPIEFVIGGNQVIDGMDEAVAAMRVGERRKLIVPPSLSVRSTYPEDGLFGPTDTLYYDVVLLRLSGQ